MIKREKFTTSKRRYVFYWFITVLFALYSFTLIYPFLTVLLNSFMTQEQYFNGLGKMQLPAPWTFDGYKNAFKMSVWSNYQQVTLTSMAWNTLILAFIRTACTTVFPICAAYCCSKFRNWVSNVFFFYGVVICAIPMYGSSAASFNLLYGLNIHDTWGAVVLMSISPFGNFLFYYGFFNGIDWGYAEAAYIDGANDFVVFLKIMLPQVLPAVFVFTINNFIGSWNDWSTSYLYIPSRPTVAYGIYLFNTEATVSGDWPTLFASIYLSLIGPLAVFLIFRDKIMNTVYTGGLKG